MSPVLSNDNSTVPTNIASSEVPVSSASHITLIEADTSTIIPKPECQGKVLMRFSDTELPITVYMNSAMRKFCTVFINLIATNGCKVAITLLGKLNFFLRLSF